MTDIVLPRLSQVGANEWADVQSNDEAIANVVNGELDNSNLSGSAAITDANLASPNNSVYRSLFSASSALIQLAASGTYILGVNNPSTGAGYQSGANILGLSIPVFNFAKADYEVAGKTQKLRLRAQVAANATKPALKFTFGLYPVTFAGGSGQLTVTLGTVVTGSTVEINEPAASTVTSAVNSDFAIPSDGEFAFGVVTSTPLPTNSSILLNTQLQTRNV